MRHDAQADGESCDTVPSIWLSPSELGWAKSGVANGIGQFSFIRREGYTMPFTPVAPEGARGAEAEPSEGVAHAETGRLVAEAGRSLLHSCPNPLHEFKMFGRTWYWQWADDCWATEERNGCIAYHFFSLRYITPAARDIALYAMTAGRLVVMTAAKPPKGNGTAGSTGT